MATKNALLAVDYAVLQNPSHQARGKMNKGDSLKILNQSKNKLTILETQRIANVLEECIQKMKVVSRFPAVLTELDRISAVLGEELLEAMQEHLCLEDKLSAHHLHLLEVEAEEKEAQLCRLEEEVQTSLRCILRQLSGNPAAAQMLQSLTPSVPSQLLVQSLEELYHLLLEKLHTSSAEEQEKSSLMQEMALKNSKNMELVSTLEAEVADAVQDLDAELSKRNEVIWKLKKSLHQTQKLSADFVSRTEKDSEKESLSDRRTSEIRCARLQQEIIQLCAQLYSLVTENCESETALRKRIYKVETEIENWIEKYDTDMDEKQTEIEEQSSLYAEEKEELQELEERYTLLEVEFLQIVEERRIARQQQEEERQALAIKGQAALVIQAFWRGYRVRKTMKAKMKGKKGKKAKGRKGK